MLVSHGKGENYLTDNAGHCTFGRYHKKNFLYSRAITQLKLQSTIKPVINSVKLQELEVLINPVKFHSDCISSIREVVLTNFKI